MSKYQQRIIINNPEKKIPDAINKKLFEVIESGNLQQIKDFILETKSTLTQNDAATKSRLAQLDAVTKDTIVHKILLLDEHIANNSQKLEILNYLANNIVSFDSPNANNIWPIHLAATLNDKKIVDFLISKNVSLNVVDSSGNTPLHYAIYGKSINCPEETKIKPLSTSIIEQPPQKNTSRVLNTFLLTLFNKETTISSEIIKAINTITNLNEMLHETQTEQELKKDILSIFVDVSSENVDTNTSIKKQIELIVDKYTNNITDGLFKDCIRNMKIELGNTGWGYKTGNEITDIEKILEYNQSDLYENLKKNYDLEKNKIIQNTSISNKLNLKSVNNHIEQLIIGNDIDSVESSKKNTSANITPAYGKILTTKKVMLLHLFKICFKNYSLFLSYKITNKIKLSAKSNYDDYIGDYNMYDLNETILNEYIQIPESGKYLLVSKISEIIQDDNFNANAVDILLADYLAFDDYIDDTFNRLLSNIYNHKFSEPKIDQYCLFNLNLFKNPFKTTLSNKRYDPLKKSYLYNKFLKSENSFMDAYSGMLRKEFIKDDNLNRDILNELFKPNQNLRYVKYVDALIVFDRLCEYLANGNFENEYPKILDVEISKMYETVDVYYASKHAMGFTEDDGEIHASLTTTTIREVHPILIFLFEYLVLTLQDYLFSSIKKTIDKLIDKVTNTKAMQNKLNITPDNEVGILNPIITNLQTLFIKKIHVSFNDYLGLIHPFKLPNDIVNNEKYIENMNSTLDLDFNDTAILIDNVHNIDSLLNEDNINCLTNDQVSKIELDTVLNKDYFLNIFNKMTSTTNKKQCCDYFVDLLVDHKFINYLIDILDNDYTIENPINQLNILLNNNELEYETYLIEVYGYIFIYVKQLLYQISSRLNKINDIIKDITASLTTEFYYLIPQIFLPLICFYLNNIDEKRQNIIKFMLGGTMKKVIVKNTEGNESDLNLLYVSFKNKVNAILDKDVNDIISNILTIYNKIIDYLNFNTAYKLVSSTSNNKNNLFNGLLKNIDVDKNNLYKLMKTTLNEAITYYYYVDNNVSFEKVNLDNFTLGQDSFDKYLDINLHSKRTGRDISQLNIIKNDDDSHKIMNRLSKTGIWLQQNNKKPQFDQASIGFNIGKYNLEEKDEMPYFVKSLAGKYLEILKQKIIESTVIYIFENNDISTQDLLRILHDSDNNSTNNILNNDVLNNTKIAITIAKSADLILTEIFKYSIKIAVSNWVESLSRTTSYKLLAEKNNVLFINKNDADQKLAFAFSTINQPNIKSLVGNNLGLVEMIVPQIETDPDNIKYTSTNVDNTKNLIHYLYDSTYFMPDNIQKIKKCRYIDINVVKKLITSNTINKKNLQGMTPLHYAVTINHPQIARLLIAETLTPNLKNEYLTKSDIWKNKISAKNLVDSNIVPPLVLNIKNMYSKTPTDLMIDNLNLHLRYNTDETVNKAFNEFTLPFNDLLISNLKEERYGNNILKNISYGVPICLSIYNHMWLLYLQNYRYNIDYNQKIKLINIIKKYTNISLTEIYPYDLFRVESINDLTKMLNDSTSSNNVKMNINSTNKRKIELLNDTINKLDNQITGATNERDTITDNLKINFINRILNALIIAKQQKQDELENLQLKFINDDTSNDLLKIYQSDYNKLFKNKYDKIFELVDFYNDSFNKLAKTNSLKIAIWNNYLNKSINNSESIIFVHINNALLKIIDLMQKKEINSEIIEDTEIILDFTRNVKKYIELKMALPQNLTDNPLLAIEFSHVSYLLNLLVIPQFKNIIYNEIYKSFTDIDLGSKIENIPSITSNSLNLLAKIEKFEYNGLTIDKFFNNYTEKALSYYSKIFTADNNQNYYLKRASDEELFEPLFDIIKSNTIYKINDESPLIIQLKTTLIPFLANTFNSFQSTIRLTLYGYEKYLLNTYQLMEMNDALQVFTKKYTNVYTDDSFNLPHAENIQLNLPDLNTKIGMKNKFGARLSMSIF